MSTENVLRLISEENNVSLGIVKRYYDILKDKQCVLAQNEHSLLNCLNLLVQFRTKEQASKLPMPFDYSLSDALFKTYYISAYDDLTPAYIVANDLYRPDAPILRLKRKDSI